MSPLLIYRRFLPLNLAGFDGIIVLVAVLLFFSRKSAPISKLREKHQEQDVWLCWGNELVGDIQHQESASELDPTFVAQFWLAKGN